MAQRRMFNRELVGADNFLDMPISSQLLFFHLGVNADDEGFVSAPNRISRGVGCSADDMKVLIGKGFIYSFDSGVVVISNWEDHNRIRKDRMTPTIHQAEKRTLQLIENKQLRQGDNQTETKRPHSIVEVSIVKVNKNTSEKPTLYYSEEFEKFWVAYDRKGNKRSAYAKWKKLTRAQIEEIRKYLPAYLLNTKDNLQYRKNAETYLNPQKEYWKDVVFLEVKKNERYV